MNSVKDVIETQISLLATLNRELAGQATPEAAREFRKNVRLIVWLAEIADLENIQFRVKEIEDCLLGRGDHEEGLINFVKRLDINIDDHEERLNDLEARTDQVAWDILEEDDSLPDFPYEDTLMGLRERVKGLEKATRD
ncbi:MAG TPA: hypothetical protein DD811_01775 [Syntrophomonas sp.]|nr:hypothetical protein [Syntrophomonas sp.]